MDTAGKNGFFLLRVLFGSLVTTHSDTGSKLSVRSTVPLGTFLPSPSTLPVGTRLFSFEYFCYLSESFVTFRVSRHFAFGNTTALARVLFASTQSQR